MRLTPVQSAHRAIRSGLLALEGPLPLLFSCLVGATTSSLYNTMVSVALPDMARVFDLDLTIVQWVLLVYLLTNSSTIAISGRLADLFGTRRIYRLGLMVFCLGGIACAAAPSFPVLVGSRIVQAFGTGMFVVSVPAIVTAAFPDRQRGRVLGLYGTAVYLGQSIGPLLGGLLTEVSGWRGVFAGTVLIAAVALALAYRYVPVERARGQPRGFDLPGSLTYITTLVPILLALSRAQQWGGTSAAVLGLLALGAGSAALFLLVEWRATSPVVDLRLFSSRYFALSAVAVVTMFVSQYPVVFLMPFYLVQARGISPGMAGLLLTALPVSMVLVAPLAGMLSDRLGPTIPAAVGVGTVGLALVLLAQLGPASSYLYIVLSLALIGVGTGLGDIANNSAIMGAVSPSQRGMASGTIGTSRYIGQALGVAIASAVFTLRAGQDGPSGSWSGFTAAFLTMSFVAAVSASISLGRGLGPPDRGMAGRRL